MASFLRTGLAAAVAVGALTVTLAPVVSSASTNGPATAARRVRPCDIYGAAQTPCVAAYSTVRALYASYGGPLYQVQRASDNAVRDIGSSASPT